jgi:hypothetical protein
MLYADGADIGEDLSHFTIEEIMKAEQPIKFGRADVRAWKHLIESISQMGDKDQTRIHVTAGM